MRKVDPVIFDLNSDGKYASNIADGVYFDYDGDGFREKTAWADKEDGILVRDINENGFIDDGKELFGDKTVLKSGEYAKSGFEALSELDTNSDGKITNDDEAFKELKIWIDRNNDGISQSDELYTLDDKNIAEIDLNFKSSNRNDQNGNIIKNTSNYVNKDGIVGNVAEMNFTIDSMDTVYQENTEIEDELVKDIPNIKASGEMISLREAVYNNPKLGESVRKYISSTNEAERNEYLNKIIIQWTGCENIEDGSRGDNFNATKLAILEKFYGRYFEGVAGRNPNAEAAPILENMYAKLLNNLGNALLIDDTILNNLLALTITTEIDGKKQINYNMVCSYLNMNNASDASKAFSKNRDFVNVIEMMKLNKIYGFNENDTLNGSSRDELVFGGRGDDILNGGTGNDLVISDGKDGNLVIKEWYSSDDNKIETINTADGYSITNAQLQLMIDSMASFGTDDAMSQDIAANSQTMQKSELMSKFWTKK